MDLITLVVTLVIVGVVLWAINTLIPMDPKIKTILNVVVIIVVLLWLLSLFTGYFPNPRIGHR
jgi:low temperature requirement protein LtrA